MTDDARALTETLDELRDWLRNDSVTGQYVSACSVTIRVENGSENVQVDVTFDPTAATRPRTAHAAYTRGERTPEVVDGEREYQRTKKRQARAAQRAMADARRAAWSRPSDGAA